MLWLVLGLGIVVLIFKGESINRSLGGSSVGKLSGGDWTDAQGAVIIQVANDVGIDPTVLGAIRMAEHGAHPYNYFG